MTGVSPADELTERLLDAAAAVFAERGYDRAAVAEIARRAGVTTGAIYSRYSGKDELLLAAVDRHMPDELRRLTGGTAAEVAAVDLLADLGAALAAPDPCLSLLLEAVVAGRREPELGDRLRFRIDDDEARLAKLVEEAKADGRFDPELPTEAVVRLSHAIGLGMAVLNAVGVANPDPDAWSEVIQRLLAAAEWRRPSGGTPE